MNVNHRLPLLPQKLPGSGPELQGGRRQRPPWDLADLLSDLQSQGARWQLDPGLSRTGGAGPSDHKALTLRGHTLMVPIFTSWAKSSPYEVKNEGDSAVLYKNSIRIGRVSFPKAPNFYSLSTSDGVPYYKLATLHSTDVLATTVLQNCIRYSDRTTSCQFCAIGHSLHARNTIARKTPAQLAEVARAAVTLDGVTQMVMTTGTPPTSDRGAAILVDSARAVTAAVDLAIQAQCEPPDDFSWFERLRDAGVTTVGMHLEAVTDEVRQHIMPGKAEVPVAYYLQAFEHAVRVFGRGEVTTYILAGLGDPHPAIVEMADKLSRMGVYPFVVPFVPIVGTPMEDHPGPDPSFMKALLDDVAYVLSSNGLSSQDASAGCGKCGACSTLKSRESEAPRGESYATLGGARA